MGFESTTTSTTYKPKVNTDAMNQALETSNSRIGTLTENKVAANQECNNTEKNLWTQYKNYLSQSRSYGDARIENNDYQRKLERLQQERAEALRKAKEEGKTEKEIAQITEDYGNQIGAVMADMVKFAKSFKLETDNYDLASKTYSNARHSWFSAVTDFLNINSSLGNEQEWNGKLKRNVMLASYFNNSKQGGFDYQI